MPQKISAGIELIDRKGSKISVPFIIENDFFLDIGGADKERSSRIPFGSAKKYA
jgi:hypothetical protein